MSSLERHTDRSARFSTDDALPLEWARSRHADPLLAWEYVVLIAGRLASAPT